MNDDPDRHNDEPQRHECYLRSTKSGFGDAITEVHEDEDGHFVAGNDEYGSQVNFCPVCGVKAPTPAGPRQKGTLEK